ncbi:MAG: leucine-rich repeat protein [Bacteroidales bacterium]|nr:leucine-rich repeat protein [Bacteroidales bacterium]
MRKILFSLVAVLFAITAVGQVEQSVTIGNVKYTVQYYILGNTSSELVAGASAINRDITSANILGSVTIGNQEYDVVVAGQGFLYCDALSDLTINDGVRKINSAAFGYCTALDSITFPASLECLSTTCFSGCTSLRVVTCLGTEAPIFGCGDISDVSYVENTFSYCPVISTLYLPFGANIDSYNPILHFFANIGIGNQGGNQGGNEDENEGGNQGGGTGITNFVINEGETVTINNNEIIIIPESAGVINNGNLTIEDGGQLVLGKDMTGEGGTEAMAGQGVSGLLMGSNGAGKWSFLGAPFNGYKLAALDPVEGDVAVSLWNYSNGTWGTDWPTIAADVTRAEGFLVYPFSYNGDLKFSTKPADEGYQDEKYSINNGDFEVVKNAVNVEGGKWTALANPYTFNLDVATFLADQQGIQGGVVYTYNGAVWKTRTDSLEVTDGFMLNFTSAGEKTISFKESQGRYKFYTQAKSTAAREFVTLTMFDGEIDVDVMFAHNEEAEQGYDIFDANKLFATTGVAEPYFVTDGIALVKEEAKELPYYATMNVRSDDAKNVKFVAKNIPEGLAVSIIDGEEVVEMIEGAEYATEVLAGENANRFKVLVKKNVGIADVEELDVTITNNNRQVNITADKAVRTEVYNILGQKVYETTETNFELNGVASGAYVVKVYNNNASKTQKIVVE